MYMLDPAGELTLLLLVHKTADSSRAQLAENREQMPEHLRLGTAELLLHG